MLIRGPLLFVLLLTLPGVAAVAAERLEFRIPEGFSYSFDNLTEMDATLDIEADGQTMVLEQEVLTRIAGTVDVLKSNAGIPSSVRIRFAQDSGTTATSNGATETTPFALAGQTLIVDVENEDIVAVRRGDGSAVVLDDDAKSVVAEIAIAETSVLPGRPVTAGDTWVADMARDDRPLTPVLTMEVAGFGEQGGRRIAKLEADGSLKGSQQGFDMDGRVRGPIIVDVATGMALSSRLSGTIDVSGSMNQNGTAVTMSGAQQVTITSSNTIGGSLPGTEETTNAQARVSNDWIEFRHSSGASLEHPKDWQVQDGPDGVRLIPPNSGSNEMIVASGLASAASSPSSQEVSGYLDAAMAQMLPGLRRDGPPQPIDAASGEGAVYTYKGSLPDGTPVVCDVYVTIQNGVALSLSAIAPPSALRARGPALRQIFASMAMSAPSGPAATAGAGAGAAPGGGLANSDDPRLVGMFAGESIHRDSGAGTYFNTQLVYVLNADGTLYYGAQSHFDAVTRDINGYTKWSASGITDGSVQSGRWSAQGGFLTVRWDSGNQSYFAYGFEPDGSLVFRNPRTRKLINFYRRVQ